MRRTILALAAVALSGCNIQPWSPYHWGARVPLPALVDDDSATPMTADAALLPIPLRKPPPPAVLADGCP